jgi:ABC-type uncharacterized transport system ATPase subunit
VSETALQLTGITKRFGALVANDDISLVAGARRGAGAAGRERRRQEHAGVHPVRPLRGRRRHIEVTASPLPPGDPRAALAAGIGMVHQHFTLADNLSVLDNVMLGTEPLWQPFSRRAAGAPRLLAVARRFGLQVDPDARVGTLSVGERQRVEILKALVRGARILILDEPTAVLTPQESEALFATLAQMVAQGLSIIFISHKLDEVLRVSTASPCCAPGGWWPSCRPRAPARPSWPRDGRPRVAPARRPAPRRGRRGGVCAAGGHCRAGRDRCWRVSLRLRAGEIVAWPACPGNGQQALAELLCGEGAGRGTSAVLGRRCRRGRAPWSRRRGAHSRGPPCGGRGGRPAAVGERGARALRSRRFRAAGSCAGARPRACAADRARFDVRGTGAAGTGARAVRRQHAEADPGPRAAAPGARRSGRRPLIVANQPTWGLDIGAVAYVHQQLLDAAPPARGAADQRRPGRGLALADRIAVMHHGRLGGPRPARRLDAPAIGLAMAAETGLAPMRLERAAASARAAGAGALLGAVVFTLLVSSLLVAVGRRAGGRTYALLLQGGFGSRFALTET